MQFSLPNDSAGMYMIINSYVANKAVDPSELNKNFRVKFSGYDETEKRIVAIPSVYCEDLFKAQIEDGDPFFKRFEHYGKSAICPSAAKF